MTMHAFIAESNRIEGINDVDEADVEAHTRLLACTVLRVEDVCEFVRAVAGADLRERPGMNVRVGMHHPPPGGPRIRGELAGLLDALPFDSPPFRWHVGYETLHPFMDGNGRSGRAIWAWHMSAIGADPFRLGFLHAFYYQALQGSRP